MHVEGEEPQALIKADCIRFGVDHDADATVISCELMGQGEDRGQESAADTLSTDALVGRDARQPKDGKGIAPGFTFIDGVDIFQNGLSTLNAFIERQAERAHEALVREGVSP